jgi:hypothetical protein
MPFWQMFCDRRTAFIAEQESMTIFPDLELPARTGPLTGFGRFCFALREKLARTHRTTDFFNIPREAFDEDFGDTRIWVAESARFSAESVNKILHLIKRLLFWHIYSS